MNIDYLTIITRNEVESISEEKYNFIKEQAIIYSTKIDKITSATKTEWAVKYYGYKNVDRQYFAHSKAFISDYKNEDYITKVILASNILYANTEIIIRILLDKNIFYEILEKTINKIEKIKQCELNKSNDLTSNDIIAKKNLEYLCKVLRKYYPYDNYNYMIAKLVDIVVHEKELYLNLQSELSPKIKTHH